MKLTARIVLTCCALLGAFLLPADAAAQASEITAAFAKLPKPKPGDNTTPPKGTPPAPTPPAPGTLPSEICLREAGSPFQLQITTDHLGAVLDIIVSDRTNLGSQRYFLDSERRPRFDYEREPDGTHVLKFHLNLPDRSFAGRAAAFLDARASVSPNLQTVTGSFHYFSKDGLRRIFGADLAGEASPQGTTTPIAKCLIGQAPR